MSITNINHLTNNLSSSNQISVSTTAPTPSNKVSNLSSKLYLGPGYTTLPGITNIFYAPFELYQGIKASFQAYKIGDKEGCVENGLRILQAPFSFSNALLQLSWYGIYAGTLFKFFNSPSIQHILQVASPLSRSIAAAGFVLCAIEGALETIGLVRSISFLKTNYPSDVEQLKNSLAIQDPKLRQVKFSSCLQKILQRPLSAEIKNEIESLAAKKDLSEMEFSQLSNRVMEKIEENVYLTQLSKLQHAYFQISPDETKKIDDYVRSKLEGQPPEKLQERKNLIVQANLEMKKNELTRRVHPWLANRIEDTLPQLLQGLQSPEQSKRTEAKEKASSIFQNIKIQSQKKLLIHSIGVLAVLITIAGLIASCCACPFVIPLVILMAGAILSFVRYYLHRGLMDTEGWNFSVANCIPEIVKTIYKKVFGQEQWIEPKLAPVPVMQYTLPGSQSGLARKNYEETLSKLNFRMAKV